MPKPTRTLEGALGIARKIVLMDLNEIRIATLIEAYINERIAALQGPGGEWRPIATAPKDRPIWIFCTDEMCPERVGYWDVELGWLNSDMQMREQCKPTHWMPLPPAPTGEG